jgi:hypothetical protein
MRARGRGQRPRAEGSWKGGTRHSLTSAAISCWTGHGAGVRRGGARARTAASEHRGGRGSAREWRAERAGERPEWRTPLLLAPPILAGLVPQEGGQEGARAHTAASDQHRGHRAREWRAERAGERPELLGLFLCNVRHARTQNTKTSCGQEANTEYLHHLTRRWIPPKMGLKRTRHSLPGPVTGSVIL